MASTDATAIPVKNQAYRVVFPIWDADGDLVTGAAGLDSEVSKDQGTFTDCTNEATEIATSSGMYYLDLTATEMNADCVAVIVKTSTSGAKTTPLVFYPQEAGDIKVNVTYWNGAAVSSPATAGIPDVNVKNIDNDAASASGTVTFPNATLASTTNITGGTITTVTNLTNAPTNGDLTAAMKASVNAEADTALADVGVTSTVTGRIDAAVSTRLAAAGYTSPPSAATIAAAVWDYLTSAATTVGSLGKLIVDNLNATIGSRSSHSAADVWAVATRLLTAGTNIVLAKGTGITGLNDLDAAGVRGAVGLASANLDTQLDALPTAAENASQVRTELTTELGRIDAAVSSRLASAGYTAPPSVGAIADQVWDEALSGHAVSGSAGAALSAASSAGDPWSTPLPGSYGTGTAGGVVAAIKTKTDNLPASPAAVGSAMTLTADERSAIALAALIYDWDGITGEADYSSLNALRFLRNHWTALLGILNVYKEDGTTVAWSSTLATSENADPVIGSNPT